MAKKIEGWMISVSGFFERNYKLVAALAMLAYFARSLRTGLVKGGRWDLYQNIAMADRFLEDRGLYYSPIEASSPYFPGVAFLSIFIGKFFNPWRDYILLVIASLTGTIFLYALVKLGKKFTGNKTLPLIVTFVMVSTGFDSYRSYMNEFKADSLVLLFSVLIVLAIDKIESREWKAGAKTAVILFILGFLMDVTKQQALYVDIAVGVYLLFTKSLDIKEKFILLGSLMLAGILDLIVVFSIPGAEIQTIKNLSDMSYWSAKSILHQMYGVFRGHIIYFALLFTFACLLLSGRIALGSLGRKWLAVSIVFGIGQIVGGWKLGGNAGNYEVGMVVFLPFTVIAADYLYRDFFVNGRKKFIIGALNFVLCGMCFIMLAGDARASRLVIDKANADKEISAYLSDVFKDEAIMYYSDKYMQLARSTVRPGMDVYSVPSNMGEYMHTREECLRKQTYKYLYINPDDFKNWDDMAARYGGEKVDAAGMLEEHYKEIEDPDMPESLKGQLFVAK